MSKKEREYFFTTKEGTPEREEEKARIDALYDKQSKSKKIKTVVISTISVVLASVAIWGATAIAKKNEERNIENSYVTDSFGERVTDTNGNYVTAPVDKFGNQLDPKEDYQYSLGNRFTVRAYADKATGIISWTADSTIFGEKPVEYILTIGNQVIHTQETSLKYDANYDGPIFLQAVTRDNGIDLRSHADITYFDSDKEEFQNKFSSILQALICDIANYTQDENRFYNGNISDNLLTIVGNSNSLTAIGLSAYTEEPMFYLADVKNYENRPFDTSYTTIENIKKVRRTFSSLSADNQTTLEFYSLSSFTHETKAILNTCAKEKVTKMKAQGFDNIEIIVNGNNLESKSLCAFLRFYNNSGSERYVTLKATTENEKYKLIDFNISDECVNPLSDQILELKEIYKINEIINLSD